jgi:hypothetical protein
VADFGIEGYAKWEVREQVRVLDYRNTNDFVIELKTKSVSDKLILAKVAPKETLAETVNGVCRRIESKGQEPAEFNRLVIPKTDFALTRTYEEFLGKTLILKRSAEWNLPVVIAEQLVRFRLDERGAMLQSEAAVAVNSAMSAEPIDLVFDKPFLILLQRVDAGAPYFALWIDNAELLAPWHSERNTIVSSR